MKKILDDIVKNKLTIIGTRPARGKMEFMSKLILELERKKGGVTLFAFDGSDVWYTMNLLVEYTGINRDKIFKYYYPCCGTGKENLEKIDKDRFISGIEFLQKSKIYIKSMPYVNFKNIFWDSGLEVICDEINDPWDEVQYIIIDRLEDVIKFGNYSKEDVLKRVNNTLKNKDVNVIIFDTLSHKFEKNQEKKLSSFNDFNLLKEYADSIGIVDYSEYVLIK